MTRRIIRRTALTSLALATIARGVQAGQASSNVASDVASDRETVHALLLSEAGAQPHDAQDEGRASGRVVEVRTYNLKPDRREGFHQRFIREVLPILTRWKVDVVAYGPSLHDHDSYFLMRADSALEDRERNEDAFYGSDDRRRGPRDKILADIESYTTIVIHLDDATIQRLRDVTRQQSSVKERGMTERDTSSDLATLLDLNQAYIRSVQTSDVRRFEELLADDFMCSLPDGSLIDRQHFLEQTARPANISDLSAHDVRVQLMGDFAIIHARTTYRTLDGRSGSGRYTDVWARRGSRWVAVSAHVTRNGG